MINGLNRLISSMRLGVFCLLVAIINGPVHAGDGSAGDPFTSLSEAYTAPSSGRYYFDLGSGAFQADVDVSEGGGWVLVLQYVHQGGTNPALSTIGAGSDLPVLSSAALGTDESAVSANWGHASNAAMSQFASDIELRWYGVTSGHSRIIHFSSSIGDDYVRSGLGSFSGLASNFTSLSGHSAQLPASSVAYFSDEGDRALTEFPYYQTGVAHWGLRGRDSRWEVDDYPDDASNDTINRVWVRIADPLKVTETSDSGDGSLRSAINHANADASADAIHFDIDGGGPHTIILASALPEIEDAGVSIDASTQNGTICGSPASGSAHTLMVQLDSGSGSDPGFNGLSGTGSNVTLRGLSITRMTHGVSWFDLTTGLKIECSYIGLAPNATTAGNYGTGLYLAGNNHTIGGLGFGDGNVISGNIGAGIDFQNAVSANIQGNVIGTNPTGSLASANGGDGIVLTGTTSDVTIGGASTAARNLISGNGGNGIHLDGVSDIDIFGNYVGLGSDGSVEISNSASGIYVNSANTITVGNGNASGRNIMGSSVNLGVITATGVYDSLTIADNYIGTDATGNTALANGSGSRDDAVRFYGAGSNVVMTDNVIAGFTAELIQIWDNTSVTNFTFQGNHLGVGADGSTALPSGRAGYGLFLVGNVSSLTNAQIGGSGVGQGNIIAHGVGPGFDVQGGASTSTGTLIANQIFNNGQDGVTIRQPTSRFALLSNQIYGNGRIGIDIGSDGITENDSGDGDTGTNDLLNFPVLNTVVADGTTTVSYDVNLDVPANADGYRIEFFQDSAPNPAGNGEGETYLGFVDVAHGGGDTNFTGTFTAAQTVPAGASISATTTRKTGATSFDVTSEFATNITTILAGTAELDVHRSVTVYDPGGAGLYMTPGSDVIVQLQVSNSGTQAADTGSIELIDSVGDTVRFYNSTTPEFANAIIGWSDTGSNLTFTPATDLAFSDAGSRPANFAACTYTPSAGYDPAVTYICLNPKGAMAAGDPDPEFTLQYRVQIE